ncbi:MAG: glycoside hydrolase family 5 protein [Bacteroidetes bacterium]|nr:glycoside hydrolase family 5 protein [Bacteroidota bacterium]
MRTTLTIFATLFMITAATAQLKHPIRDEQGRHVIPRGFVINTEDKQGNIYYTANDYHRMVRMGANFQVIRLRLGALGGYPGNLLEESYLLHLDSLVQMGKNAGLKTDFKLTVYMTKGFEWADFWKNENGEHDHLTGAWKQVWVRYKDEPAVFGYDLLNEPRKGEMKEDYAEMEAKYLVPLYRRLMDESHLINPAKKCLYQPLLVNDEDRKSHHPPFVVMQTPVDRENIMYAPHIYDLDKSRFLSWIRQYERDAALSDVPIFFGEWGPATYDPVDSSLTQQYEFQDLYMETAHLFDSLGVGTVKAWFTGTRFAGTSERGPFTWSIFKDNQGVGTIERKYITDIIARPYPQCIAGDILEFSFDLSNRSLVLDVHTENAKGASKIFIPADRYYPDGFTVTVGETMVIYDPTKNVGLEVVEPGNGYSPSEFIWDSYQQQLVILKWPVDDENIRVLLQPGIYQEILMR